MRPQCKRIYSALPSHCDRICKGRCDAPCDSDASPEFRVQSSEGTAGVGLSLPGSSLSLEAFTSELFQLLDSGVASLSDMRNGRPWPRPRKDGIRKLVESYDEDTCRRAAREAREIVQSQDFAPNVTGLFAKKCADVEAERKSEEAEEAKRLAIRDEIRRALA